MAAAALDQARSLAENGEFKEAQQLLAESAANIRAQIPGSTRAAELAVEADKLEEFIYAIESFNRTTSKRMHYDSYSSRRSRRD